MNEGRHIIYLAGFMASGKSTIGPQLARELAYDFVDIDDQIEAREGLSIAGIFQKFGEQYFRTLENQILNDVSKSRRNIVVALGGGTLTQEENRRLIHSEGVLIYLNTEPGKILERVGEKQDRPMLLDQDGGPLSGERLSARIESLLREREKHYLEANIIVNTSEMSVDESVEEIRSKLHGKII